MTEFCFSHAPVTHLNFEKRKKSLEKRGILRNTIKIYYSLIRLVKFVWPSGAGVFLRIFQLEKQSM
jgi:hypothetical protein